MDKNTLSTVSLVVSLATLVLVAYTAFFGVSAELNKLEALKVGGSDNYKLVQEIYGSSQFKQTQKDQLQQAVSQFNGTTPTDTTGNTGTTGTTPTPTASADGFTRGTLTADQVSAVTKDVSYEGKADSNIVLIEYSDIECPFCQRHFTAKTVDTVINTNSIKTTFKHFPLSFHPNAQKAGEAVECAAKQDKGIEYKNALFAATIASSDAKPTQPVLLAAANTVGLDEAAFSTCLTSGETASKVAADMNEGSTLFGVSGTPGNVLLNTDTGKYVVVAGAYPADQFNALVTEIK